MAVRKILTITTDPEGVLRRKAAPVGMDDPALPGLIQDMKDTLLQTPHAVGLAAPQIGVSLRIFVLRKEYLLKDLEAQSRFARSKDPVMTFINAKIVSRKGTITEDEGCLSIPGTYVKLERTASVKVRAMDETGEQFQERFKALASRAVQQEIDHLNGQLIIDYR